MKKALTTKGLGDTNIVPREIRKSRIQVTEKNLEHAVTDDSTLPMFELPKGCPETRQQLKRKAVDSYKKLNVDGQNKLYCPDAFRDSGSHRGRKAERLLARCDSESAKIIIGTVGKLYGIHRRNLVHLVISLQAIGLGRFEPPWNIFIDRSVNAIKKRVKNSLVTGPALFSLEIGDNFKLHLHVICGPQDPSSRLWSYQSQVKNLKNLKNLTLYLCKCPFPIPGRTRKKRSPQTQQEFNAALEFRGLFLMYQSKARDRKARAKKAESLSPGSTKAKPSSATPGLILPRKSFSQGIPRQRRKAITGQTNPVVPVEPEQKQPYCLNNVLTMFSLIPSCFLNQN